MLEISRRNMDSADTIRVYDDELSAQVFAEVTKEDITANGKLRPSGARHFFSQQQLVQNMTGLFNSPVGQLIAPHVSSKQLAKLAEDLFGLERYQLISDNIALIEQAESQRVMNVLQEQAVAEDSAMMTAEGGISSGA
jgi:hypothetical protein